MVPCALWMFSCDGVGTKLSLMSTTKAFSALRLRFPRHEMRVQATDRGASSPSTERASGSTNHGGAVAGVPGFMLRAEAAIVLAGALPSAAAISRITSAGIKLMCFAPALVIAKKLVRMGADAIIIETQTSLDELGLAIDAVGRRAPPASSPRWLTIFQPINPAFGR